MYNVDLQEREQIKAFNEQRIKNSGYTVNEWLPVLEDSDIRDIEEIKGRALVMTALVNIAFEAPVHIISGWVEQEGLTGHLSGWEKEILGKENDDLSEIEMNALSWYTESLWAFMWLLNKAEKLEPEKQVSDTLVTLVPNLQKGEDSSKIAALKHMRLITVAFKTLDYYFRLHWYCVDERLNGRTAALNEGLVAERRRSLEWAMNKNSDWDYVDLST